MIGVNLLLETVSRLLGAGSWKKAVVEQGEAVANLKLEKLMGEKLVAAAPGIAARMKKDGWTWAGAAKKKADITMAEKAEGAGFLLCRDALYRMIKALGLRGGILLDGWRDAADNKVWAAVKARPDYQEGMDIEELVNITVEEFIRHTL